MHKQTVQEIEVPKECYVVSAIGVFISALQLIGDRTTGGQNTP